MLFFLLLNIPLFLYLFRNKVCCFKTCASLSFYFDSPWAGDLHPPHTTRLNSITFVTFKTKVNRLHPGVGECVIINKCVNINYLVLLHLWHMNTKGVEVWYASLKVWQPLINNKLQKCLNVQHNNVSKVWNTNTWIDEQCKKIQATAKWPQSVKNLKINTVGLGLPPQHKNGCYTLVAKCVFQGSTWEFLGWPHRDAQGGLILLVGVYLRPLKVRWQPHMAWSQRTSYPFLYCKHPPVS